MPVNRALALLYRRLFMHRCVHAVLTWVMVWFSYSFGDTYTLYGDTALRYFSSVATEDHWQAFTGCVGAVGFVSLFTTRTKIKIGAAMLLSATHFTVAVLFFLGNKHVIATGPFVGYAFLGAALAYSTAHVDQRFAHDMGTVDPEG